MAPLTGRKVLAITVAAFTVIIGVNIVLAVMAVRTFPGMETKNSYVASQNFDEDRAAQEELGWTVTSDYDGGLLSVAISKTETGEPAEVAEFNALLGWATNTSADFYPTFVETGGAYRAAVDLDPGKWTLHLRARAADGTLFRQRIPLVVRKPS
ncbi:MAG: FixH family protein [Pseudomonadota bacterium]